MNRYRYQRSYYQEELNRKTLDRVYLWFIGTLFALLILWVLFLVMHANSVEPVATVKPEPVVTRLAQPTPHGSVLVWGSTGAPSWVSVKPPRKFKNDSCYVIPGCMEWVQAYEDKINGAVK